MRTFDLSKLTDAELLALVDLLCTDEQIRQMAAFAHVYNLWRMQQVKHRRTLHPQIAAHRFLEVRR
ncbi:MAG: hypothetical protein KDE50_38100 [Caldilineaceae bacterium]|nr:hypothetical protein [Caldilineaceae bacterium]MCB0145759.1 hypothetical protein [Caldilineaceae bacterium]